mmetsp:Transcript_11646/g.15834  ORF Transcript_11646/g.15834 Transcript_11646/m.15834 type:complete len:155 (+) Transcript_11646:38-502(+)|eukprot:CAMPEP_0196594092 /NCGR_PEP_ID=MMETSP1081-20130531/77352_1 /TAXON_ID=36882 /ORGANISM="Pyramimonas amylifera, Strain CCMP720" /LENGTH=154 /DNA_ID=CAMNT_0041918255 /DNA_START=38 /DNA_END=502 /DNA_ORIENTATION=+
MSKQDASSIDLSTLGVEQLQMLKEQLDGELDRFTESFQQLQTAANRFHLSGVASENLSKEEKGRTMMIPLTSSLYVPGTLDSTETVLVDVGTGYYVEKTPTGASDFCKRKVMMLKGNMERLHAMVFEKRKQVNQVAQVYQAKMLQSQKGQAQST